MTQTIIVIAIIGICAALLLRRVFARKKTACGCDSCPVAKPPLQAVKTTPPA